jgi:hypothetical protein
VRRALAEVRSGTVPRQHERSGPLELVFGAERVRESRVVPGTPRALAAQIDAFVAVGSLRERVRKQRLEPVDADRTRVVLELDPGTREEAVTVAATGVGLGAMFGFMTVIGMYDAISVLSFVAGPVVAAGIGTAATLWARRAHQRGPRDAREVVEGVLDRLEAGHYHGLAKDATGTKDD